MLLSLLTSCEVVNAPPPGATRTSVELSPAATAAPTPLPAPDLLASALERRAIGDYDGVALDLSTLIETYPEAVEGREARYYLAESFALRGRWTPAVAAFREFLDDSADDELTARALFWMARGYESAGDWSNAAMTYERYRERGTPLEPYAAMRQAAQQQALGQFEAAAANYEHAAATDIARGERAGSYEKAIALYRQLGQNEQTLALYVTLLDFVEQPAHRARILDEAANLAQQLGRDEQAQAWLLDIVAAAPAAPQAASAVDRLLAASFLDLSPADAARAYFNAERYDAALEQFDRALAQAEVGSDTAIELQRLRGLTLRGLGRFPEALQALALAGGINPNSEPGRQAQLDWIQTVGQSGETQQAIDGYREYADAYPDDPRAPEALSRAAQLLDRLGQTESALQVRLELGRRYPKSDQAVGALPAVGLTLFRAGRYSEAQQAWNLLVEHHQGYEQARGAFWAARSLQAQQPEAGTARDLFNSAVNADPESYYGVRATEELSVPFIGTRALDAAIGADEWRELEIWLDEWSEQSLPDDAERDDASDVADSGFMQRATALAHVGLQSESIAEWNAARAAWADDPGRLMRLARLAHEQGVHYIALKTAEQLAVLAPDDAPPPPLILRRLIFPTPYADLIIEQSRANNIDPRLLYALLRQESLFNPGATSWVGARGLAQVMPATGEGIAQRLSVANFTVDDLYRPIISIQFGAFYIGQRIADMEGSVQGGLSAYNAGLGNAQRWAGGSRVNDSDLFTEGIDYAETENYVKLVYGYYGAYQQLYTIDE